MGTNSWLSTVRSIFGNSFSISRWYSAAHDGIDLAAKEGTPVYSVAAGTVEYAKDARIDPHCGKGWACGGGNVVNVNIGNNYAAQYAHLQKFVVSYGQHVDAGQLIGYVGRTGGKTSSGAYGGAGAQFVGSHLHFGLWDHSINKMVLPNNFLLNGTAALGHGSTPSGGASTPLTPSPSNPQSGNPSATGETSSKTTLDKLLGLPADLEINLGTITQITDRITSLLSSGAITQVQATNLQGLVGARGVASSHGLKTKLSDVSVDTTTGGAPGIQLPNIDVGAAIQFVAIVLVGIAFLFLGGIVILRNPK